MSTLRLRSWSVAALTFLAFAGTATAQTPPSAVLNTLEVRWLVASTNTADQTRLASHFAALAERYTAQAKRHTAMASSDGNPNHPIPGLAIYHERLARLNNESATTLRGLAEHHARLATGAASTAPPDSAGFEMGAGASRPTDEDLAALVARAQTSAEHRALEEYFAALEKQYASDAVKQKTRASAYRGLPRSPGWAAAAAVHFDQLASRARAAAQGAKEAAATQGRLAGTSR